MTWGLTSDHDEHRARSRAASNAFGQAGRSDMVGQSRARGTGRLGSRGGAPIWVAHIDGFGLMPSPCTCGTDGPRTSESIDCPAHGPRRRLSRQMQEKRAKEGGRWGPPGNEQDGTPRPSYEGPRGIPHVSDEQADADPDGYAVFGRYPKGFLSWFLKRQLLGNVGRDDVLHVCSGTLTEKWTVDVRAQARPAVQADGAALPFRDASFRAVAIDPPYSDAYARNLYGVENPRPSWLLREAARVVTPGGRVGILHVAIPFAPPDCFLVRVWPVSTGVGFRIRAFTVYERRQAGLF